MLQNQGINLFIASKYCPHWNHLYQGLREIHQNYRDANTEYVQKTFQLKRKDICVERIPRKAMEVDKEVEWQDFRHFVWVDGIQEYLGDIAYNYGSKELTFENYGVLPIEALVLGGTEKPENPELIGRFGEGMKICALTLLRAGKNFRIMDQKRGIRFYFRNDPMLNNLECLHYSQSTDLKGLPNRVKVIIGGVNLDEWVESYRLKFLDLSDLDLKILKPQNPALGSLLFQDKFLGQVFVKELFVCDEKETKAPNVPPMGFLFEDLTLDRDRKSVPDVWERNRKSSMLIADVLNNFEANSDNNSTISRIEFAEIIYKCLLHNNQWTHYLHEYISQSSADIFYHIFRTGANALECYPITENHMVTNIMNKLKQFGLPNEFYLAIPCSWQVYHNLVKSKQYIAIDTKIQRYLKDLPETAISDEIAMNQINKVLDIAKLIRPAIQIKFKQFKGNYRYKEGNTVYLSDKLVQITDQIQQNPGQLAQQLLREIGSSLDLKTEDFLQFLFKPN